MSLNNSESKQTTMNLLTGILTMLVQLAVNFFLSPYIVVSLGEEANGFTQLANNFVSYATLITLAFNSMASRFMSVSYHQGKHEKVKKYYSSIIICNVVICMILIPFSFYLIGNLNYYVDIGNSDLNDIRVLFLGVFINFYVNLFLSVYSAALFVRNKVYIQNIITLLRNVLNAVMILCVFCWLPPKMYYVSVVTMLLTILAVPVFKVLQHHYIPQLRFSIKDFSWYAIKEMFFAGIWNTINQCGHMLMTGFDLLLANWFLNPIMMGVLSVAKIIPTAIMSLSSMVNTSFAPALVMDWSKGDMNNVLKQLRGSMKISSIIVSIPIVTFCSFGREFYSLWMPTLDAKVLVILSLLSCMAFIPWAGPQALYNVFSVTNHLKVNSIAFVVTGILNVIIVYGCLKYTSLGVFAIAGVSSTLSIIRNLVVTGPYTAKLLGLKWYTFYKDVGISLVCCGINFVVAMIVLNLVEMSGWIGLIIKVLFTCLVTLVLDIAFVLNKQEFALLQNKISKYRK